MNSTKTVHEHNYDMKNINNGLLPRIWGPHMWKSLHCISFAYPYNPTDDDKKKYKAFFESLSYVIPCSSCGKSYKSFIENGSTKLTDEVFISRNNLTKWVYDLHEAVNAKLCVNYGVTYDDIVTKYESFRVKCEPGHPDYKGCIIAEEERRKSFCNEYKNEYPIIPLNVCLCFKSYAEKRGVSFDNIGEISKHCTNKNDEWDQRNKLCHDIVKKMRETGIKALEDSGIYEGLPTMEELILLSNMASSLNVNDLIEPASKLGSHIKKKYVFRN